MITFTKNNLPTQALIFIVALLLFIPFLGKVHLFDWDEINFAESAREMLETGDYLNVQINYQSFWEKPPLFIWMQAFSMKIFGVNEFAARFPNALAGIVTLCLLFAIGKKHYGKTFGLYWTLAYAGSILPHFYFKSGIIDPWFNLFIFLGVYLFVLFMVTTQVRPRRKAILLSAFFIGLATLTKGPVALLVFLLCGLVYLLWSKFKLKISISDLLTYVLVFSFVGGFWFILQILTGNFNVILDFIHYQIRLLRTQDAGHGGFFGYHFVVLFFGVFPASIFALSSFGRTPSAHTDTQKTLQKWMKILFWVVLILFSIVKTKIVHYSSLCYFPLTFLAALAIYRTLSNQYKYSKATFVAIGVISFLFGILVISIPFIGNNIKIITDNIKIDDAFALGNLEAQVRWSGFEALPGIILILGVSWAVFQKKYQTKVIATYLSVLLFVNLTMTLIVPKIEQYSQNAALTFYKNHQHEAAYIETYGFKSYAHLFYGRKKKPLNPQAYSQKWILEDNTDKTVYIVCKITAAQEFQEKYPNFKKMYQKNGFVFFLKLAPLK